VSFWLNYCNQSINQSITASNSDAQQELMNFTNVTGIAYNRDCIHI